MIKDILHFLFFLTFTADTRNRQSASVKFSNNEFS